MKIFSTTYRYIKNQINKFSGDTDDICNIPDIAETFTDDKNEKYNPLCYDFWRYQILNNKTYKNIGNIVDSYKNNSDKN